MRQSILELLKGVKWQDIMGPLRDQKGHDMCWAIVIVVSELIRALRHIEGRDKDFNIIYSPQELIDFVDPEQRKQMIKQGHYCYPSNLTKGFEYVMKNGIQREEDRPFIGCLENIPDYTSSSKLGFVKDFVKVDTIHKALLQLKKQPIGATVAMFIPEYRDIGKKIYRGPVNQERSSHGDKFGDQGYIKISIDVVLLYIPTPSEEVASNINKYFSKPRLLLGRFSYPRLLTEGEEETHRKMQHAKRIDQRTT